MKRTKQCPKCQSLRIGYLPQQPDVDDVITRPEVEGIDPTMPALGQSNFLLASRALGLSKESVDSGWWRSGAVTPLLGRLEAYVCTECGYHETYVASPGAIPWEKLVGFAWVNPVADPVGPFR